MEEKKIKKQIVKYDNTFNKTSLSLFTKVQADILLTVLSRMSEEVNKDGCCIAKFSFNEIRKMVNAKNLHTYRIKEAFDALLDTKVEFYTDSTYEKGNLFSHYIITNKKEAEIVLTKAMTNKIIPSLLPKAKEYTILNLNEYVNLTSKYSKELYRLLRQFRYSGMKLISKKDLFEMLNPPKSHNEYDFVRKILLPAIEENKAYFENLAVNVGERNELSNLVRFTFKPHKRTSKENQDDMLFDYVKENTPQQ